MSNKLQRAACSASKVVSYIAHPSVIPAYASALILFYSAASKFVPLEYKLYIIAIVLLSTAIVPAMSLPMLKAFGLIKSYALSSRRDRIIPMIIAAGGYAFCGSKLSDIVYFPLAGSFFAAATTIIIIATIITYFWQISLHMAAISGATTLILFFTITSNPILSHWLALFIFLSGALASARLYLGRHNILQVVAGTMLGFLVMLTFVIFDI